MVCVRSAGVMVLTGLGVQLETLEAPVCERGILLFVNGERTPLPQAVGLRSTGGTGRVPRGLTLGAFTL